MNESPAPRRGLIATSILAAAASSACCWLPMAALALGFSAAGLGASLDAYRGPFIALAAGLLVGGVMLQRRSQRRACERDGCPPRRGSGLALPILGAALVVGFVILPPLLAWRGGASDTPSPSQESDPFVHEYAITGMTCEGCTDLLVSYLEDQPEIERATVSFSDATAQVSFAPDTTPPGADTVMTRVSADWDDKYEFTRLLDR